MPLKIVEISQRVRPCQATVYQKVEILPFCGPRSQFPPPSTDWREILHGQANPCAPRLCKILRESVNESPLCGENADFRSVSKFCTFSLPLRGTPAGKNIIRCNTVQSFSS